MGLPLVSEFLVVLYIISRRTSSKGDWRKAPIYATSYGDASSDEETALVSEQAARVLQSHFDCEGDDTRPIGGIPIETRSRRQCSVETVSVSSESCTISNGASSCRRLAIGKGVFGEETPVEDLLFDIEADFSREKEIYPGVQRHG